jgi:hypothetical protein
MQSANSITKGSDFSDSISTPPTLKFLDDIKSELAGKRQTDRIQRGARFVDHGKNETQGADETNEYGSNEYVSFFDDFENSLLKQESSKTLRKDSKKYKCYL